LPRLIKKKGPADPGADYMPHVLRMAELAAQHKGIDIRAYDVRELTVVADAFVVCSAASEPQMRAIFNEVREGMREAGKSPFHSEGDFEGNWVVIDYGSVIFHLFRQEAREFYDLDGLWADAPQIAVEVE